ncbi:P-loop containing nucleoside triphosphate hydrolase [Sesbania bispinosa]|nr:P-loop containing nucleoside triphosphate hydrolase [Sesbania bispinosa]
MGSKIIVTTRDRSVALAMQTFLPIHYLTPLESEDDWSLLAKHAFGQITPNNVGIISDWQRNIQKI